MSYGLSISNPSGELLISSDAQGLYCVGKAVLQGAVVQPSGIATGGYPGRLTGYSIYRISHPGPIIVALDLPIGKRVGVLGVSQPASGVWDIKVHCGDTPDSYGFDNTEYALDVWAFGAAYTVAESYGLALYNAGGVLAHDLSRPNTLYSRAYIAPSMSVNLTIPSVGRAVIIGVDASNVIYDDSIGSKNYYVRNIRGSWKRTSATVLTNAQYTASHYKYIDDVPRELGDGDLWQAAGFILEGATLP